jgi:hypothetical protein
MGEGSLAMIIAFGCSRRSSLCQNGKDREKKSGSVHVDKLIIIG